MTHVPLRMCAVCRKHLPAAELIRAVADKESQTVVADMEKKKFGRGAYICRNAECIKKAQKNRTLEKHLKCKVSEEFYTLAEDLV